MKKLNKKGFTLIELLAVIVILAIVLVVTIPSVIRSLNSARTGQLENAADTVAEWFTKNYQLTNLGELSGAPDTAYTTYAAGIVWDEDEEKDDLCSTTNNVHTCDPVLEAAGVAEASKNIQSAILKRVGNKICVQLIAKEGGSFYNADETTNNDNIANSSGCSF